MTTTREYLTTIQRQGSAQVAVLARLHEMFAKRFPSAAPKRLTKRVESWAAEALEIDSQHVRIEHIAGLCYLRVWGLAEYRTYDAALRIFLGYDSDEAAYTVDRFTERADMATVKQTFSSYTAVLALDWPERVDAAKAALQAAHDALAAVKREHPTVYVSTEGD